MNGPNGTYVDPMFGLTWQVNCGQDTLGAGFYNTGGTGAQGIAGCFKGCAKRPNCLGFYYAGTVDASGVSGSGVCYYKTQPLPPFVPDTPYSYNAANANNIHYAGVALLNPGYRSYACPMYNNTQYNDQQGNVWSVSCGGHYAGASPVPVAVSDIAGCMSACNAATDAGSSCTAMEYALTTAEPTTISASTRGSCYRYSTALTTGFAYDPNYGYAVRVGSSATVPVTYSPPYYTRWATTVTPTGSTATGSGTASTATGSGTASTATTGQSNSLSASASSPAATSSACLSQDPVPVPPATPAACPAGSNYTVTSACGNTYYIYCGYDTTASDMANQPTVSSVAACIQQCDSNSRCQAATYASGICYWKSAYKSLSTTTSNTRVAIVRYIPPNPNYAVPALAPGTNTSSGCGTALPAGLVPDGSSVYYSLIAPDGKNRTYKVHIPRYYDINRASPLIFGFHGNGDTASGIESQTGFNDAVLNPYGIAVYVDGWNKGFQSNPDWATGANYADDLGFMRQLMDTMSSSFCVDTGRIWVTGQSNGGGFSNYLACDPYMSSRISVFSASCGAFYTGAKSGDPATIDPVNTPTQPQCSPSRNNLPFLEFHGTNDGTIPYTGGIRRGYLLPTLPRWATAWAIRQGYSSSNVTSTPSTGVTVYQYGGRGSLGIITQYTLANWVHDWPRVAGGAPVDASPLIMNFFYDQTNYNRVVADGPSLSSLYLLPEVGLTLLSILRDHDEPEPDCCYPIHRTNYHNYIDVNDELRNSEHVDGDYFQLCQLKWIFYTEQLERKFNRYVINKQHCRLYNSLNLHLIILDNVYKLQRCSVKFSVHCWRSNFLHGIIDFHLWIFKHSIVNWHNQYWLDEYWLDEYCVIEYCVIEYCVIEHGFIEHGILEHGILEHCVLEYWLNQYWLNQHCFQQHCFKQHWLNDLVRHQRDFQFCDRWNELNWISSEHTLDTEHSNSEHGYIEHSYVEHSNSEHGSIEHCYSEHGYIEHCDLQHAFDIVLKLSQYQQLAIQYRNSHCQRCFQRHDQLVIHRWNFEFPDSVVDSDGSHLHVLDSFVPNLTLFYKY
ncbi:hypothetical protein PRZ48_001806 [Zasmidium cellare]|uniref:feruloyl esterase n=1 Tax=Zasmidium cellare TaxID=395010 RepID=A0ABR0F2A4_ZASCE|nr:hypothetical protein PRZ48_001806 [Zasmidium cellare]